MGWPQTVRKSDLEITWFSGTGGGGQHRNKHSNCCRMKHKPTGMVTTGQSHKERPSNQREAFSSLVLRLAPMMKAAAPASIPESEETKSRIRTYHFPNDRVTDHRVRGRVFPVEKTLDGELDPIIEAVKRVV